MSELKQTNTVDVYVTLNDVKPEVMDRNAPNATNATNANPSNPINQSNSSTCGNAFNDIDWWYCCIFEENGCDLCCGRDSGCCNCDGGCDCDD